LGIRGFGNGTDRKRVGVVRNPNNPNVTVQLRETEDAVRKLNLQVQVRRGSYLRGIRARIHTPERAVGVNGVVLLADPTVIEHGRRIAELAQAARLPTAFQRRENVEAGGLLSEARRQLLKEWQNVPVLTLPAASKLTWRCRDRLS
jgi:ABC-type uncharacterized transport system substrate-binding protein